MNEKNKRLSGKERKVDMIVFGATGFTEQFVVEEMARTARTDPINWAISGRNARKLNQVLVTATEETGIDTKNIPMIETDINDQKSVEEMALK